MPDAIVRVIAASMDQKPWRIGKPVVTSDSATLWRALALADTKEPIRGYGRLLAQPRDVL